VRFKNNTLYKEIDHAIKIAESLLNPNSPMMNELREKNDFAFNSGTGEEVYMKIVNCKIIAPVFTYRPLWRFTAALGYSDKKGIHLNIYRIDKLDHVSLVSLLCHEASHHLFGFSHGNNYKTEFKCKHSVPYWLSENAWRFL
jgi:hypothetical protein